MHIETRKTTVTFERPFRLDGLEMDLPAGEYGVESENDVLDGMFLPDSLRTSVLIHPHSTAGTPGYSQTLAVPWEVLEAALSRDRSRAAPPIEPGLEEMLLEPIIRLLMRSDGVSEASIRDLVSHLPKRKLSHAKSER